MSTVLFLDLPPTPRGLLRRDLAFLGTAEHTSSSTQPAPVPCQFLEESWGRTLHSVSCWESSQAREEAGSQVKLPGVDAPV